MGCFERIRILIDKNHLMFRFQDKYIAHWIQQPIPKPRILNFLTNHISFDKKMASKQINKHVEFVLRPK